MNEPARQKGSGTREQQKAEKQRMKEELSKAPMSQRREINLSNYYFY